jgi:hypothetical protein
MPNLQKERDEKASKGCDPFAQPAFKCEERALFVS